MKIVKALLLGGPLFLLFLMPTGVAWAELKPEQVAIVAMDTSREGQALASHYAKARGIPASHILLIPGPRTQSISRQHWERIIRPAIAKRLVEGGLDRTITCLVLCWDVPLKIGARPADSPAAITRKAYLAHARVARIGQLDAVVRTLNRLANPKRPAERLPSPPTVKLTELLADFQTAVGEARNRVVVIEDPAERRQASQVFEKLLGLTGGASSIISTAAKALESGNASTELPGQIEKGKARISGWQDGLRALNALPDSVSRDAQILGLLQRSNGLFGTLQWIDEQLRQLVKNESQASLDSELSLIHWPEYPVLMWQDNQRHHRAVSRPATHRTLMVARLAAPEYSLAVAMIDNAVRVEQEGLEGIVYLDARYRTPPSDSYGKYDKSLHNLSARLKEHTDLEVVLDTRSQLFQPGDCLDAALYCGWYALGNYVDAFDWEPGAVGYHLASLEAKVLLESGSKAWCPAALEDGITVTLGPVSEPYLTAFPLPDEFFSLLLTGRFTLAEIFYFTKPYNSWQMTLVGDPLYNPYKNHPKLDAANLPEHLRPKQPALVPSTDTNPR